MMPKKSIHHAQRCRLALGEVLHEHRCVWAFYDNNEAVRLLGTANRFTARVAYLGLLMGRGKWRMSRRRDVVSEAAALTNTGA